MDNPLRNAIEGLLKQQKQLQAQVAQRDRMLKLSLDLILDFSHLFPNTYEKFKDELLKLGESDE